MDNVDAKNSTGQKTNLFGWAHVVWGVIMVLLSDLIYAVLVIVSDDAEDSGVSANCVMFWGNVSTFIMAVLMDLYFYFYGYSHGETGNTDKAQNTHNYDRKKWFVFIDIWKPKQLNQLRNIKGLIFWFILMCVSLYCLYTTLIISFAFCNDVSDAVAIAELYPIVIPLLAFCLPKTKHNDNNINSNTTDNNHMEYDTSHKWKHRYFLCIFLAVIGLIFAAQPGFIFGYSSDSDINATDQAIGIIWAVLCTFCTGLYVIASTVTYSTSIHSAILYSNITTEEKLIVNSQSELTPLKSSQSYEMEPIATHNNATNDNRDDTAGNSDNNINSKSKSQSKTKIGFDENSNTIVMSSEFIVLNEHAFTVCLFEYLFLTNIVLCLVFSLLSLVEDENVNQSSFWYDWAIFYTSLSNQAIGYVAISSILIAANNFSWTFGIFKMSSSTLTGIIDTSGYFFTLILSIIWLKESPTAYEITGCLILVLTVILSIYPWQKHDFVPKSW